MSSRKSVKVRRIDELLENLEEGDRLIVSEISRLGRSVGQIIQIIDTLIQRKIKFIAIKEAIIINKTQNIQTKTMVTMFGLFAEIERDLISERTKQALAVARKQGTILGRPKGPGKSKLDQYKLEIEGLLKNRSTKAYLQSRLPRDTKALSQIFING